MKFLRKIFTLFRRQKLESEMTEEMWHHVELQTELNVKSGMNPDEARYRALRQFGNVASVQERARDGHGYIRLEQWARDLRHAIRSLLRVPRFTFTVVFTLALGIGATVALVGIARRALLPSMPFPHSDRLVTVSEYNVKGNADWMVSFSSRYVAMRGHRDIFAYVAAHRYELLNLVVGDQPDTLQTAWVTADFFNVFTVQPEIGRTFSKEEYIAGEEANVLVLSHAIWVKHFGRNPEVLNRPVLFGGKLRRVIGVMPALFRAYPASTAWEIFLPQSEKRYEDPNRIETINVVGLLAPGISLEQANVGLSTVRLVSKLYPDEQGKDLVARATPLKRSYVARNPRLLHLFLAAAMCFYAIACTNVTNLLLLRILSRQHEIAVRVALGGTQSQIVRSISFETLLLSLVGGIAGIGVAYGSSAIIGRVSSSWLPAGAEEVIDPTMLIVTVLVVLVTALLVGTLPGWRASRQGSAVGLKDTGRTLSGSRRISRLRAGFVMFQTALATVLLVGGALFLRTFWHLQKRGVGIDPANKIVIAGKLPMETISSRQYDLVANEFVNRIRLVPGVERAAVSSGMPFDVPAFEQIHLHDRPGLDRVSCWDSRISDGVLGILGVRVLAGREFKNVHATDPGVAMINESFAKRLFPQGDPIGQILETNTHGKIEVVGIVSDVRDRGPRQDECIQLYTPFSQRPVTQNWSISIIAELQSDQLPAQFLASIQKAAYAADPRLTIRVIRISDVVRDSVMTERASLIILQTLSVLSLGLAAFGLYAVMAYGVALRQREFGIRLALGAIPADLLRLVFGIGLRLVSGGVLAGLGIAWVLARLFENLLYETSAHDPAAFIVVALMLGVVATLASWLPARRAAKVDPIIALRTE